VVGRFFNLTSASGRLGYHAHNMRELHGATTIVPDQPLPLKQQALLFDKIHLIRPNQTIFEKRLPNEAAQATLADLDFLQERGLVEYLDISDLLSWLSLLSQRSKSNKTRSWSPRSRWSAS
jgi:hypothetical protein